MKLDGIDGTHLFGFMATMGTIALLTESARARGATNPRLSFLPDGVPVLHAVPGSQDEIAAAVFEQLQEDRPYYEQQLSEVKRPTDLTAASLAGLAATATRREAAILAGLACCVGDETTESSLCAANGASHQNLVQAMRDILALVRHEHLRAALFEPWRRDYAVPDGLRKEFGLGSRKPTLRLDPGDERLYALRLSNPTTTDDFMTELGAQALAIPAFGLFPVLPRRRPVAVASERAGRRVYFNWLLWETPATLATVSSLLAAGPGSPDRLRPRGVFAAFRAARVSGDKGKLSFAPTEGVW